MLVVKFNRGKSGLSTLAMFAMLLLCKAWQMMARK